MSVSGPRPVVARTAGSTRGFIRRLVSPGDLGESLKPFVFLDHVHGHVAPGSGFGWHPHSGIATLTYPLDNDVAYEDTTGQRGVVQATGLEWMRAGRGTWHKGAIQPHGPTVEAFQLWVALPPGAEEGPSEGRYVPPADVPRAGNVRVLLGRHGDAENPLPAPSPMVYLDVVLAAGGSWTFTPPAGHTVAWAYVYRGTVDVSGTAASRELLVFAEGEGALRFDAKDDARFLFGAARKHPWPLVLGSHSVHTSPAALAVGQAEIRAVAQRLRAEGRLG